MCLFLLFITGDIKKMITHLLTRIDLMMNSLSKGQKRIALFIEEHYDKAAFMTASKLTVSAMTMCLTAFLIRISIKSAEQLKKHLMRILPVQLMKFARQSVFTYSVCVQQPQSQTSLRTILK